MLGYFAAAVRRPPSALDPSAVRPPPSAVRPPPSASTLFLLPPPFFLLDNADVLLRICTLLLGGFWLAGCASTGAVPSPFPAPGRGHLPERPAPAVPEAAPPVSAPLDGYSVAGTALGLRGVPYRNGGSDPSGFDCSGLVWYVFAQHGLALPRTVEDQYRMGEEVDSDSLEPGDLVFFRTEGRSVSHVGMSIGGDEFVHAPSARGEVRVERLGSSYWWPRFAGARRVR